MRLFSLYRIGDSDLFKVGRPLESCKPYPGYGQLGDAVKGDAVADIGVDQASIVILIVGVIRVAENHNGLLNTASPICAVMHPVNDDIAMAHQRGTRNQQDDK